MDDHIILSTLPCSFLVASHRQKPRPLRLKLFVGHAMFDKRIQHHPATFWKRGCLQATSLDSPNGIWCEFGVRVLELELNELRFWVLLWSFSCGSEPHFVLRKILREQEVQLPPFKMPQTVPMQPFCCVLAPAVFRPPIWWHFRILLTVEHCDHCEHEIHNRVWVLELELNELRFWVPLWSFSCGSEPIISFSARSWKNKRFSCHPFSTSDFVWNVWFWVVLAEPRVPNPTVLWRLGARFLVRASQGSSLEPSKKYLAANHLGESLAGRLW